MQLNIFIPIGNSIDTSSFVKLQNASVMLRIIFIITNRRQCFLLWYFVQCTLGSRNFKEFSTKQLLNRKEILQNHTGDPFVPNLLHANQTTILSCSDPATECVSVSFLVNGWKAHHDPIVVMARFSVDMSGIGEEKLYLVK